MSFSRALLAASRLDSTRLDSDNSPSPAAKNGRLFGRVLGYLPRRCVYIYMYGVSRYPRSPLSGSHPIDRAVAPVRARDPKNNRRKESRLSSRPFSRRAPSVRLTSGASYAVGGPRRSSIFPPPRFSSVPYAHVRTYTRTRFLFAPLDTAHYTPPRWSLARPSPVVSLLLSSYNSERNRVDPERGAPRGEKVCSENSITFYRILTVVLRRSLKLLAVRAANATPVLSVSLY